MIRILHSVSNMDRAGIETMLMNYYRHIDRSKIQFDFLCNKKKPGAYDAEIKEMGGNIYHTPGLNPAKYPSYLKCMKKIFEENPEYKIVEAHNGALGVYALHAAKVNHIPVRIFHAHGANGYYAPSLSAAINTEFTVIVEQLLLIVMICQVVRSREDVHLCVKTIVNASGVVAIISIINVLIGSNLFYNLNTVSRNVLMVSTVRMGIIRAEATFGHPVYYAMYCALIIPLALYVWQNEKNAWNSCVLGLNVIAAFLTESRGTIVVLLALFLVYVIIADKKTRNRILTAVCAIACVAVVVSFVVPTVAQQFSNIIKSVMIAFGDSSETIENFGGNSSTGLESRMIQLSGITWMLMHNAIFGLGASCHTRGKLSYYINGAWSVRDTIDNGYVGYFVEEGLLGGIACFSLFYSLLKSSWKKATFKNSRNMNNSFFLCFVSYVAVMLSVADVSQLLWVIIALYITYNAKAQAIASE